eukprot:7379673-Prymnesium_polylepis.1
MAQRSAPPRGSGGCETATGVMGAATRAEKGRVDLDRSHLRSFRIFNKNGRINKCKKVIRCDNNIMYCELLNMTRTSTRGTISPGDHHDSH